MSKGRQEVVPATVGLRLLLLGDLPIRDVFDREQYQLVVAILRVQPMSVQQHCFLADLAKTMGNFEIAQGAPFGQDSREQLAEPGDVPLAVAEIIEIPLYRLLWPKMERFVKLMIRFLNSEVAVEHQQRLSERFRNGVLITTRVSKFIIQIGQLAVAIAQFLIGDAKLLIG